MATSEENEPGILGRLPHSDLLTFLSLAQKCDTNLLEYTPRFDDRDAREGGNALVQMVYLSSDSDDVAERLPTFAFKRHDLARRGDLLVRQPDLDPEARLKKVMGELIIYENPTILCHPNIANIRGISWSITAIPSNSLSLPIVNPVLGFQPARGNLADVFAHDNFNLIQKLEICRDIGHALETVHSLNIAHGDLKPENVLLHEDSRMIAKLIDFDSSSFGLTDSDHVSISGTKGWFAPELTRGNCTIKLSEAFKADIYSFGKLCAWIIFYNILNYEDYVENPGRTIPGRFEKFNLWKAVDAGLMPGDGPAPTSRQSSEKSLLLSLESFFSATFVGIPKGRHGNITEVVQLLEQVLHSARSMDVSGNVFNIPTKREFAYLIGLTKRPYRRSRYRITQLFLGRVVRIIHTVNGTNDPGLTFAEKQWVYRTVYDIGFSEVFHSLHIIVAWILGIALLLSILFSIKEHVRFGKRACQMQGNDTRVALCYGGTVCGVLFGFQFSIMILYFLGSVSMQFFPGIRRRFRHRTQVLDIEMTDTKIFDIGRQLYRRTPSPSFWKAIKKLAGGPDGPQPEDPPPLLDNDILPRLQNKGKRLHLLPELIAMGPLLNRLHYRVRLQVVDNLRERLQCPLCQQQASDLLAACALLGFGESRSIEHFPLTEETVRETLDKDLQADLLYKTSLPQLPFAVRNQIQDDRADLFTFDEMPSALHTILSEVLAKFKLGTKCRNTQILCSTMGRLFTLLGRHEEAALSFYTALTYRPKPAWRTYNDLSSRLNHYSAPGDMGTVRRSNQLAEAEHDLFLFSLVHELNILGRHNEAIRELKSLRDIMIAPNGLYLERETGKSFAIVVHRLADARNQLVLLLLEHEMLSEIEEMNQEFDLPDLAGVYAFTQQIVPEQVHQCFDTTEQVASMFYRHGRFSHAIRLQRRLLRVWTEGRIQKTDARMRLIREALALSLSRHPEIRFVEEANQIQQELIQFAGTEDKERLSNLRLNSIYTLVALGRLDDALLKIKNLLQDDPEWKNMLRITNRDTDSSPLRTPSLWLHELPDSLRTIVIIHRSLLAICAFIEEREVQLKLIALLCANPPTTVLLDNFQDLTDFLTSTILQSCRSVHQQIILWDRLICLLTNVGLAWELPQNFVVAQQRVDEMTNTVSLLSDVAEDETRVVHLTALVLRMKARHLNIARGFGAADKRFWRDAVDAHRRLLQTESKNGQSLSHPASMSNHSLALMLKEKAIAFHDGVEAQKAFEDYQDGNQEHQNLFLTRVEYAHLSIELGWNKRSNTSEEYSLQTVLTKCVAELGPAHPYTNQTRTWLAHSLEHGSKFIEAQHLLKEGAEISETLFGSEHPQALRARFHLLKLQSKRPIELGLHPCSSLAELSSLRYLAAKVFGKEHATTQEYLGCYALALEQDERAIKEAISLKRDVVEALTRTFGPIHTKVIQERCELAGMLCRRGGDEYEDGRLQFELSLKSVVDLLDVTHPKTCAIWRQCVSTITPSSGQITSSSIDPNQRDRGLDPEVLEIYLSRKILGVDHLLTTMLQHKFSDRDRQSDEFNPSDEDLDECFPIPPSREIKGQWDEFLEAFRSIANQQLAQHQRELEDALALGRDRFAASGGLQFEFVYHVSEEEEVLTPE